MKVVYRIVNSLKMKLFHACTKNCLSGQTSSGKTTWVYKLLQQAEDLFTAAPGKILHCYGVYQSAYDQMEQEFHNLTLHEGIPLQETLESFVDGCHNAVILDDLMMQVVKNENMEKLFTQGAHHRKLPILSIKTCLHKVVMLEQ